MIEPSGDCDRARAHSNTHCCNPMDCKQIGRHCTHVYNITDRLTLTRKERTRPVVYDLNHPNAFILQSD